MSQKRTNLSETQLNTLVNSYEGGLQSVGKAHANDIKEIAKQTGLEIKQVKSWISNRKRTLPGAAPRRESCKLKKKLSAYSLFCSEMWKRADMHCVSHKDRCRMASVEYAALPHDEKEVLKKRAAQISNPSDEQLMALEMNEKLDVAKRVCASIQHNLHTLDSLGLPGFCVIANVEEGMAFCDLASSRARNFINKHDVISGFAKAMSVEVDANGQGVAPSYSEYKNRETRSFDVFGMPDDVPFHRPSDYGKLQCQKLKMKSQEIYFKFRDNHADELQNSHSDEDSLTPHD